MRHEALAASMLGLAWLCACGKHVGAPAPSANAGVASSRASAPAPSASTVPHLTQVKQGCRALAVVGKSSVAGAPITVGTLLDGEHWVELDAGASVSLRHTLTSRELKLIGPGLVLPCRHGAEQILLANGSLSTSENLGVRPGAEVLIATPSGTIHYGDAAIDVQYGAKGLRFRVKQGEAWLEPQDPTAPHPKNPVQSPKEVALPASQLTAQGLAAACQAVAERAEASARSMLELGFDAPAPATPSAPVAPPAQPPRATGSLGERAAAQIRDRAAARAACSTAAAAAGGVTDPAARQSLWASIAHSDELWQSVPRGVSAQKN